MTLYRDMNTPDLVRHGSGQAPHPTYRRALIHALAARLEQEYQRAERHLGKSVDAAATIYQQASQLDRLQFQPTPPPGYIKVAKPHIQQVFTRPGNRGMWRCTGSFGTVQYGNTPGQAYAAWRKVMEQGRGIPRKHKEILT